MSQPEVILFDVMGTIVREPFLIEVPAFFALSREELYPLLSRQAWFAFERGELDEAGFAEGFFRDGRDLDIAGLKSALISGYAYLDGMESLLASLAGAGVTMHALSNYPDWYRLIEDKLALSRFLEWSFVSCQTGVRKPDAAAFTIPVARLGLTPQQCLFIDDRTSNCEGARAAGLTALLFSDAARLRSDLAALGFAL
jgi:HAD superfamily hydrolase (TIGR01509 family)